MALDAAEREQLIQQYSKGPAQFKAALAVIEAARTNTVALLRRLPERAWSREGRHTESGRYTAEDWLRIYAVHLEEHARQIESNLAAWHARQ
jgi:hypothetical protein